MGSKCPDATLAQLHACGSTASALADCVSIGATDAATALTILLYGPSPAAIGDGAALACQMAIGKAGVTQVTSFGKANEGCLDKLNTGSVTGDAAVTCLGAWETSGPVAPADVATAGKVEKAATKTEAAIEGKCSMAALDVLDVCGGGSAAGVADCIRCGGFAQVMGLVDDAY